MQYIQCRRSHTLGNLLQNLVARHCNTFPRMLKSTHIAMLSSDELHRRQSWQVNLVALSVKLLNTVKATCEHFTLFTFAKPDNIYTAMLSHKCITMRVSAVSTHQGLALGTRQDEQRAAMLDLTPYSGLLYAFAKHIRCML